jgi:glycogen operon protein
MLLAGDEFGRTQHGNNNAYCQDNELSWVDWSAAQSPQGESLIRFVSRVVHLRHRFPALQSDRFPVGEELAAGIQDIAWFDETGQPLSSEAWQNPEARALAVRRASLDAAGKPECVLMFVNAGTDPIDFRFPPPRDNWYRVLDTAADGNTTQQVHEDTVTVQGHSVIVFCSKDPRID